MTDDTAPLFAFQEMIGGRRAMYERRELDSSWLCLKFENVKAANSAADILRARQARKASDWDAALHQRAEQLEAALRTFMAIVERSQKVDQHNPYSARELWPEAFAAASHALNGMAA